MKAWFGKIHEIGVFWDEGTKVKSGVTCCLSIESVRSELN